jgi:aminoglycoside phosphotransferase (APT) family kinase protein
MDDALVLESLAEVLAASASRADGDLLVSPRAADLVVRRRDVARRRSSMYFVGMRDEPLARWVVKEPHPEVAQLGLRPPVPAEDQLLALQRLHRHLRDDEVFHCPAPAGLLSTRSAFAMAFVRGRPVSQAARSAPLGAGWSDLDLGLHCAAQALQRVHCVDAVTERVFDLDEEQRLLESARITLAGCSVRTDDAWFEPRITGPVLTREVTLHGDWAPENVLLGPDGVHVLDPDLAERGLPEQDLARFLVMLFDPPVFTVAGRLPSVRNARRAAARTFLRSFGVSPSDAEVLRPVLVDAICARWAVREGYMRGDSRRAGGDLLRRRRRLVRAHFASLLDEVTTRWPDVYLA